MAKCLSLFDDIETTTMLQLGRKLKLIYALLGDKNHFEKTLKCFGVKH